MLATATGFNWYDILVALLLLYGLWSGVRTGLTGELIRVTGLVLMVVLAVHWYQDIGGWIRSWSKLAEELANLIAFVVIAIAVFAISVGIRALVHNKMKKFKFGSVMENVGGGFAGVVRMASIAFCLTILLCLMRSPFWHEQIGTNSASGRLVVASLPSVEKVVHKQFPEKLWFMRELNRPDEPEIEEQPKKK